MAIVIQRAALYARFSSDNQRLESIDAQIRAMKAYCQQQRWQIVATYVDEAKSATTDKRPNFQQMIEDSGKNLFDIVLVHKLDRFSRNRYDSAIYKSKLKKNHVSIASVLERIDDSPESVMMEAMLEGMAEYYSKNLSREVMKGMNETALQCKHTGGCCPLGYDLDSEKRLIINPHEAEAVRTIYEMYASGYGYTAIIDYLNDHGYHPKRGGFFKKNSLHDILGNEKYMGTFVFNRATGKDHNHRRNNHASKPYQEMIRVENGCPAIVSRELFEKVQQRRKSNRTKSGSYHSKEFYLLTGKLFCGVCGKRLIGKLRFSGRNKTRLATYRCNTHRSECRNKEINKEYLDVYIEDLLGRKIFNPKAMRRVVQRLNAYIRKYNSEYAEHYDLVKGKYEEICESLTNITAAIEKGIITESIVSRAQVLEQQKNELTAKLNGMHQFTPLEYRDFSPLIDEFRGLNRGTEEFRTFVQRYVNRVTVLPYHLEIELNMGMGMAEELNEVISLRRGELYGIFESRVKEG